jgi:nicotinamide riboside kinase
MSPLHIIISGASSVGKSTLVEECLKKFREDKKLKFIRFKRIQEVARTVLGRLKMSGRDLQNYISTGNINAFSNVQLKIIDEQVLCFDKEKDKNYLSDRSGFDALAYIYHYFKNEQKANSVFESEQFQSLINQCRTGLIFIIQPQEELQAQNDNMRIVPSYEDQIGYTESLEYYYKQAHLPYFVLTDLDLAKRVEFIIKHINGYFHYLPPEIPIPLNLPFHLNKPEHHGHNQITTISHSNQSYMRYIEIFDKQNLKISYKIYDQNRLVEKYDPSCLNNKFASILFDKKLDNTFIEQILLNGVLINNEIYHFIGYSNSQLKGRSCYLYNGTIDQIQQMIYDNGDFQNIKNLSKRAARIGLLFSSCTPTIDIQSHQVIQIDDVERNGYTFTDG